MGSRTPLRSLHPHAAALLLSAAASAQVTGVDPGPFDCTTGNEPPCAGQWSGPFHLCISCDSVCGPAHYGENKACASPTYQDEIGHAALIPTGDYAGMVLVWTRGHNRSMRGDLMTTGVPYESHIWDPSNPSDGVVHSPDFDILYDDPADPTIHVGPFCAGHTWMLDSAGDPKLLAVGGEDFLASCNTGSPEFAGAICGTDKAFWFDPATAEWTDEPKDFPVKIWYPSLLLMEDNRGASPDWIPLAIGGSGINTVKGCVSPHTFMDVWTLPSPYTSHWYTVNPTPTENYRWNQYPRSLLLSSGDCFVAGHALICDPGMLNMADSATWGGNPVNELALSSPVAITRSEGSDPNDPAFRVGGWNYNSVVLMHTLKNDWAWGGVPEDQYVKDRVISIGGSEDANGPGLYFSFAQPHALEYDRVGDTWTEKAPPMTARVFSNLVVLPDGSLLLTGGQSTYPPAGSNPAQPVVYFDVPERFDPQGPADLGKWHLMAPRPMVDSTDGTIRGYHNAGLLLKDGAVGLLGGARDDDFSAAGHSPGDSLEIYKPPYFFQGPRPLITSIHSTELNYGESFCVTVSTPSRRIVRACLIGIGSVTHHFDYGGSRYIELMVESENRNCSAGGNLEVLAPPSESMAPPGYYLLFVVDRRAGVEIPSKGRFVKLVAP